jgi:cytidylate kinase
MKFLSKRENNSEFDKKVDDKLIHLFKKGGMIITSYTLPWLVDDGIKIWLSGSHDSSSQRMQTRDNMTSQEAYEITKIRYDKNRALYKKLYHFDFGNDISVFDKIIDTDNLNATQVINIAKETVRELL